jgi:hypothetical protein
MICLFLGRFQVEIVENWGGDLWRAQKGNSSILKGEHIAIVEAGSLMTGVAVNIFRRGRWKTREV